MKCFVLSAVNLSMIIRQWLGVEKVPSHNRNQCWSRFGMRCVTWPWWVKAKGNQNKKCYKYTNDIVQTYELQYVTFFGIEDFKKNIDRVEAVLDGHTCLNAPLPIKSWLFDIQYKIKHARPGTYFNSVISAEIQIRWKCSFTLTIFMTMRCSKINTCPNSLIVVLCANIWRSQSFRISLASTLNAHIMWTVMA